MHGSPYSNLPKVTKQQTSGRRAEARFNAWVTDLGHIWRPGNQETDYGVDGELELAGTTASGLLVKVQIKGQDQVRFSRSCTTSVTVSQTTMNYWSTLRLPVVAVLVDHATGRIYWEVPRPIFVDGSETLTFDERQNATASPQAFFAHLQQLAMFPAQIDVIDRIPFFVESLQELDNLGNYDIGTTVGIVTDGLLTLFYDHVIRLSILLDRSVRPLIPYYLWERRSDLINHIYGYATSEGMCDLVAGEMLLYLRAQYRSLLEFLRSREQAGDLDHFHPATSAWLREYPEVTDLPPYGWPDPSPAATGGSSVRPQESSILVMDDYLHHLGVARFSLRTALASQQR